MNALTIRRDSLVDRALGLFGLFLIGLVAWAVERQQTQGAGNVLLARVVLAFVSVTGQLVDRLLLPPGDHHDHAGGTSRRTREAFSR
jgi:hypothetical protein